MGPLGNLFLGVTLWVLGLANTILMLRLPDAAGDREAAQRGGLAPLARLHRVTGYGFLLAYLVLAAQMAPRPWAGHMGPAGWPALHLGLGAAVGVLLAAKIVSVHAAPARGGTGVRRLGILLFVGATLLVGSTLSFGLAVVGGGGRPIP
jgi:hypothetical protein